MEESALYRLMYELVLQCMPNCTRKRTLLHKYLTASYSSVHSANESNTLIYYPRPPSFP